ncbi:MAG: FtsB family cell division protein [Gaiellaceae bacterium]
MPRDSGPATSRTPSAARRRQSRRRRRVGSWLAIAVLVGVALAYVHPIRSYQAARDEIARKHTEVAELERKRDKLKKRLALAELDVFVVREARTHGLVRPGETLFLVQGIEKWQRNREQRDENAAAGD